MHDDYDIFKPLIEQKLRFQLYGDDFENIYRQLLRSKWKMQTEFLYYFRLTKQKSL